MIFFLNWVVENELLHHPLTNLNKTLTWCVFSKYEDTQHIDSLHHNKKNARNNFEKDRQADGQR